MRDEKIGPSVAVIVAKSCSHGPERISGQPRFLGCICECTVAVISIKNDSLETSDKQVGPAVIVVVADRCAHRPAWIPDAGLVGNVCKCAVVVVMKQRTSRFLALKRRFDCLCVGEVNIGPAVTVVIDKCNACTHRLDDEFLLRARQMLKVNSCGSGNIDEFRIILESDRPADQVGVWHCSAAEAMQMSWKAAPAPIPEALSPRELRRIDRPIPRHNSTRAGHSEQESSFCSP